MEQIDRDLVILGGGPGGYTAAFRAADLGRKVTIVEQNPYLGGVCLNVGCIPSKTLLHVASVLEQQEKLQDAGVTFEKAAINMDQLASHKDSVIGSLRGGLQSLCKGRGVEIITGWGSLASDSTLLVQKEDSQQTVRFNELIIATGSRPVRIPGIDYEDSRVWDSTAALSLSSIPKHLVIIGAGIIGMEMAAIYHALGSQIVLVEMTDSIIPPADKDLKRSLLSEVKKKYAAIYTSTKVTGVQSTKNALKVSLEGPKAPDALEAEAVLVAVGRRPNSDTIGIENSSIELDRRGFIKIDERTRSSCEHIYAIGDVTGNPMLAHRAAAMGKVAAEVICGHFSAFTPMTIPSVAYTIPEIAWTGYTEEEAKAEGIDYLRGTFPWQASGRAMSELATTGVSKALFDRKTGRIIGAGICGAHAGELIAEASLAIEMGATAEDLSNVIHAHPTLSETFAVACEVADGSATELLPKR